MRALAGENADVAGVLSPLTSGQGPLSDEGIEVLLGRVGGLQQAQQHRIGDTGIGLAVLEDA
ncbi:MAG: hypothetical protein KDK70_24225 [Myxococcales bacterium]|nr:hypothetical protein [Myxococcales bacterium]